MKRDLALIRLSHDHHRALVVAQRLQRATQESVADAIEGFRSYWEDHGVEHFAAEEQILLPLLADKREEPVITEVLVDHVVLRRQADLLLDRPGDTNRLEEAHTLGATLGDHVRREERVLFPLLEETLSAEQLDELADRLERAPLRVVHRGNPDDAERWLGLNYGPLPGPGDSDGG